MDVELDERPFKVVDVGTWLRAHEETLGTKPKRWLQEPETQTLWLMKDTTFNRSRDGSSYRKGDDWSERVACAIAQALGLPAAEVELARGGPGHDSSDGVVSQTVLAEHESLIHGNELLAEIGVVGTNTHDRSGYTVEAVQTALTDVQPPDPDWADAWECFVGYLILDAIIGNTDRHQENWAVIESGDGRRLSPTFDHASSLGFQLSDQDRLARLHTSDSNRTPEGYARRATTKFEGKPTPLEVAVQALETVDSRRRQAWKSRCADIEAIVAPLGRIPGGRISEPARAFAEQLLRWNQAELLSHL